MNKKKGFMAILITAALLFLTQGCFWGYHGDRDDYHYRDGYGHHGDWGEHHYRRQRKQYEVRMKKMAAGTLLTELIYSSSRERLEGVTSSYVMAFFNKKVEQVMKKNYRKSKPTKSNTMSLSKNDWCWYDPSCFSLRCDDACYCQAEQMVLRDQQSSRCKGHYFSQPS